MARTTRDIIHRALRTIGVLGAGDAAPAEDATDALVALNQMLDTWSADSLLVYTINEQSFALTAGVKTYTIGTGGSFNTPRPVAIQYAYTRDSTNLDRPLGLIGVEQYSAIGLKSQPNTFPEALYFDPSFPLADVNLYPAPLSGLTLFLGLWQPFTEVASLDTSFTYPPGYEAALTYSLAEVLALEYGRPVPPDLGRAANDARKRIKGVNLPEVYSSCELSGVQGAPAVSFADFMRGTF